MSRPVVVLAAIIVLIVVALVALASVNTARAPQRVEKDMLNAPAAR